MKLAPSNRPFALNTRPSVNEKGTPLLSPAMPHAHELAV